MTSNGFVRVAVTIALYVFAATLIITGQPFNSTLRIAGAASSGVPLALLAFESWGWRLRIIQRIPFHPVPELRGTWKGELKSSFPTAEGSDREPIETYIVVRQSFFRISVRQFSSQSSSKLVSGSICSDPDGVKYLHAVYQNEPDIPHREVSPIHHGAFTYVIEGRPVTRLRGKYWTDRKTIGHTLFDQRVAKECHSFDEARAAFTVGGI
jgi:SMODS-associating 2TM, beta-strand rich effector domain